MKLLPDTNVLVYDTIEDSEHHEEAAELLDRAKELILPSIVVHEYAWVMLRLARVHPSFVAAKLQEYLGDPRATYVLEPLGVLLEALRMLEADGQDAGELNDYIVLSTAMHYGAALATFDRKLRRAAAARGVKVLP